MVDESSIGPWLRGLRDGESQAMTEIWDRFFQTLVHAADQRLKNVPKNNSEGEDIAASVFESLWNGYQEGRFQNVTGRSELWWTLLKMTRQKCVDHARRENADKRGGKVKIISLNQSYQNERELFEFLISETPSPQYLAALEEEYQRFLSILNEPKQRQIAALTLQGYSIDEIAQTMGLAKTTVRRKLQLVRDTWQTEAEDDNKAQ